MKDVLTYTSPRPVSLSPDPLHTNQTGLHKQVKAALSLSHVLFMTGNRQIYISLSERMMELQHILTKRK